MRDNFKSSFGVLVAMAGSAIGLGNLWRFPYLMGTNGGAAFIIIYLVLVFLLCLPIMMSEFVVGRRSQVNAVKAFKVLSPKGHWGIVGVLGVLASVALISFYCVVGGWTIDYLVHAVSFTLPEQGASEGFFAAAVSAPGRTLLYTYIFLVLTALVLLAGIKDGIERYTKIMMPLLFLTIIIIAVRSVTLPGAGAGLEFLFKPDFSKVTGSTFLNALGQAFFSLSIGCATILTYGSYVKKNEKIVKLSSLTAISDTFFAILAGLAIMPAVFAFGISPSEGPGLLFVVLPDIFDQIAAGGVIAILFFFVLFIAAITSSISLLAVSVTYLIEACRMKRRAAVLLSSAVCVVLCTLCALSGAGGPILVMPLLVVLGVPVKTAVGVALFNSIFIAIPSCIGYSLQCDPGTFLSLLAVSMISHGAGVWAGSRNTSFLKPDPLKKGVAVFSVCIAVFKLITG